MQMRRIGWARPRHTLPAERPACHLLLRNLPVTLSCAVFDVKKFFAQMRSIGMHEKVSFKKFKIVELLRKRRMIDFVSK